MATNKTDLAGIIAEKTGYTKKQSTQFIDAFLETVGEQLTKGESVLLIGFGTFLARHKDARQGRKPVTGEVIAIPEKTVPVFKPGKALKNKVNSG